MASRHVEDAVQAYLTANWTTAPILVENAEGETPTDGSPFIRLQFPVANVDRWAIDRRHYREAGGFRLIMAMARGTGTQLAREWGEQLATLFRDRKFDGVETKVPSEPFTDEQSDQGNYFLASMIVPYTYNFDG